MWRAWVSLGIVAGVLLGLSGCITSSRKKVQRPELVEEFTIPPTADARFSQPISYPKKVLAQDEMKNKDSSAEQAPGMAGGRGGMGGKMGP